MTSLASQAVGATTVEVALTFQYQTSAPTPPRGGNQTVFAKEPLGPLVLTGMDLVRLGLERGRTASEALEVMTGLIETPGQGGSGHVHVEWPYHNGFLIADPVSAWILETS
jgi:secernin